MKNKADDYYSRMKMDNHCQPYLRPNLVVGSSNNLDKLCYLKI